MSERQPPRHRRPRNRNLPVPRTRSRTLPWLEERTLAETVQCPPRPKGCAMPVGRTCCDRYGDELTNQTAHAGRVERARELRDHPPVDPPADPPPLDLDEYVEDYSRDPEDDER